MTKKRIKAFFAAVAVFVGMLPTATVTQAADPAANKAEYKYFMNTAEGSAYVWLGDEIEGENIEFYDGVEMGITDSKDPLYNEIVTLDGLVARKQYNANNSYFKINKDYYEDGDTKYLVSLVFYDFGPSEGKFYLEYNSTAGTTRQITIVKPGTNPGWAVKTMLIDDLDLNTPYENGAHLKIINGAYNAFKKLEVVNIEKARREKKNVATTALKAEILSELESLRIVQSNDERFKNENLSMLCTGTDASKFRDIITGKTQANEYGKNNITQGELVKMFMESVGFTKNDDESWVEASERLGMTNVGAYLLFDDAPATYFNLMGVVHGALVYKNAKGEILLAKLINNGFYDDVQTSSIKSETFQLIYYSQPRKLPYEVVRNPFTGRTYYHINFFGGEMLRSYLGVQGWLADGSGLVCGTAQGHIYVYDIKSQILTYLDQASSNSGAINAVVCANGWIYYHKTVDAQTTIWRIHPKTLEKEEMLTLPKGFRPSYMTVTNDGRYMAFQQQTWGGAFDVPAGTTPVVRADLVEKKTEYRYWSFDTPGGNLVNHEQINPVYPNLIAFSHDYTSGWTTFHILDRCNIMDFDTGEVISYNSGQLYDGRTEQMVTHEVWGLSGEHRWFSSWATEGKDHPGELPAVVKIDKDGTHRQYYRTMSGNSVHAGISGDEKMICCDFDIRLIATETHQVFPIVNLAGVVGSRNHPYHPHPHLSYAGNMASWAEERNGILGISFIDYTDILENEVAKGGRYEFGDDVMRVSYKGIECESSITTRAGKECAVAKPGASVFLDIKPEVIDVDNGAAKITFEYFDDSDKPIVLTYTKGVEEKNDAWRVYNKTIDIKRNNTKKWQTAEVVIDCGNFESIGKFETDFKIRGTEKSVYIANVKVTPIKK